MLRCLRTSFRSAFNLGSLAASKYLLQPFVGSVLGPFFSTGHAVQSRSAAAYAFRFDGSGFSYSTKKAIASAMMAAQTYLAGMTPGKSGLLAPDKTLPFFPTNRGDLQASAA